MYGLYCLIFVLCVAFTVTFISPYLSKSQINWAPVAFVQKRKKSQYSDAGFFLDLLWQSLLLSKVLSSRSFLSRAAKLP